MPAKRQFIPSEIGRTGWTRIFHGLHHVKRAISTTVCSLFLFSNFFFLLLIDKLRISMYHHTVEDQLDEINLISTIEKSIDFI